MPILLEVEDSWIVYWMKAKILSCRTMRFDTNHLKKILLILMKKSQCKNYLKMSNEFLSTMFDSQMLRQDLVKQTQSYEIWMIDNDLFLQSSSKLINLLILLLEWSFSIFSRWIKSKPEFLRIMFLKDTKFLSKNELIFM